MYEIRNTTPFLFRIELIVDSTRSIYRKLVQIF